MLIFEFSQVLQARKIKKKKKTRTDAFTQIIK